MRDYGREMIGNLVLTKSADGPWVDSRAYSSINEAITDIGSENKTLLVSESGTLTNTGNANTTIWIQKGVVVTISATGTYEQSFCIEDGGQVLIDEDCTINGNIECKGNKSGVVAFSAVTGDETLTLNGDLIVNQFQIFDNLEIILNKNIIGYAEWYGVDGVNDDIEINKILSSGIKNLCLLDTTYICNNEIIVPKNVNIYGQGLENTILDFEEATGTFNENSCVYCSGDELELLGTLTVDLSAGDKIITIDSTPSLNSDDVIIIYNSDDYSYSGERSYYRAGEYCIVDSVSGNDITLINGIYANYLSGEYISIYKLNNPTTNKFNDFQIKGNYIGKQALNALELRYGKNCKLDNLKIADSYYAGIAIKNCFNTSLNKINTYITDLHHSSNNVYPIIIGNSQKVFLNEITGWSPWHVISPGGGADICCVPNREILLTNSVLEVKGNIISFGTHGNTEYLTIQNCICDGIALGGNHNTIKDCIINMNELPYAIHLGELVGFDFTIENNIVNIFTQPGYSRGSFINCGGNELSLDENTIYGGTLSILNNKCYDISNELHNAIVIKNRGCINDNLNILCKNNFIDICPDKGNYGIDVDIVSGSNFNNVVIENNSFENCGIRINNTSNIKISNNIVKNSYQQGIYILLSEQTSILKEIYINNNIIKNSRYTGLYILSDVPNNLTNCYVFNNISIENVKEPTGSSTTDVNMRVVNFKNCYVYDNIFGGNNVDQYYPAYYGSIENLYENNNTYYGIGSVNYSDIINHYGKIQSNIADPSGGTTIDAEARSTINNILDVLEKFKLMEE